MPCPADRADRGNPVPYRYIVRFQHVAGPLLLPKHALRQWRYIFSGPVHAGFIFVSMDALSSSDLPLRPPRRRPAPMSDDGRYLPDVFLLPCCAGRPDCTSGRSGIEGRDHAGCLAGNGGSRKAILPSRLALRRILDAGTQGGNRIRPCRRGYRFVPRVTRREDVSAAAGPTRIEPTDHQ